MISPAVAREGLLVLLAGPHCYTAILLNSSLGSASLYSGSLFFNNREAALKQLSLASSSNNSTTSCSSRSSRGGNSSSISDISSSSSNLSNSSSLVSLPSTPEGRLAAWLGVDVAVAQRLLDIPAVQRLTWAEWQKRLAAATHLMVAVGYVEAIQPALHAAGQAAAAVAAAVAAPAAGVAGSADATTSSSRRRRRTSAATQPSSIGCYGGNYSSSNNTVNAAGAHPTSSGSSSSSSVHVGSRRRRQKAAMSDATPAAATSAQQNSPMLIAEQQQQQQQQLGQQQLVQIAQRIMQQAVHEQQQQNTTGLQIVPPSAAQEALEDALSSGQSLAVAAVSVACLLSPFSRQLYQPPPRPPDCVAQLVVQHPDAFARETFESNCNTLAALVQASPHLHLQLQGLTVSELAAYTACTQIRLRYVQYLVETQQPLPWAVSAHTLLLGQQWYSRAKGQTSTKEKFSAAYPGYQKWEEAMQKL